MKIIVSQQNLPAGRQGKKLIIEFQRLYKVVDKYRIDKADDFISVVDKFLNKRNNLFESVLTADLKFFNVSILTERIIRSIIAGLRFPARNATHSVAGG